MAKKIIALLLAVLMIAAFAGCSGGSSNADGLEKIKANGVLKVGMECAYAPFNWTQLDDSNGAVKIANSEGYANGYDVQVAQKIADALGVKLEVYSYEWDALIPAVQSGVLDCVIAGMSPTDARKQEVDFSSNYYVSNLVMIVEKNGSFASATSIADFKGAKIGAQSGTFHADAAAQIENAEVTEMADFTVLYTALTSSVLDGYISEEPTAYSICAANDDLTYVALVNNSTGFTCTEGDTAIAVAMKKGSSAVSEVSAAIDAISESERADLMKKMVELAPIE